MKSAHITSFSVQIKIVDVGDIPSLTVIGMVGERGAISPRLWATWGSTHPEYNFSYKYLISNSSSH